MLDYVAIYFILTGGSGYRPPLDVRNPPCGIAGAVVGLHVDRPVNPTIATWPDPYFPGVHCEVDIRAYVSQSEPGQYHLATTEMGKSVGFGVPVVPYIGIDPHTTDFFTIGNLPPPPASPATIGIAGTGMQPPAARTLSWDDPNPPEQNIVGYVASKNGVAYPQTSAKQQPVLLEAYGTYQFAVIAVAGDGRVSAPATLGYTLEAPPPTQPPLPPPCSGITLRVDDWTRTIALGGRGKVALTLIASQPIVLLQVRLAAQVIGEVTGADLRDLAGLYFSVPRVAGSYNISVAVKDSTNCTAQTTAIRTVTVQ